MNSVSSSHGHPPVIGSQLFINRNMTPAEASVWVKRMRDAGLLRIRLFMVWDFLEPEPDRWTFSTYDAVFDTAQECGMDVVPTLMSISPPGWMLRTGGVQAVANLEDPAIIEEGDRYIDTIVQRWGSHPALHSWILWNEASRILPRNSETMARFRQWLCDRFQGEIQAMNALQFRRYSDFDQVGRTREEGGMELEFATYAEGVLWQEFTVVELCRHLARIGKRIRMQDSVHPLHVNPHNLCGALQHAGQSVWKEAEVVDFLGCSSHPVWHATRFPRHNWLQAVGMFADVCRSASPSDSGEFWVSELQGGTTRLSAMSPDGPDRNELARWIWAGIGAGASTTLFWCFNWRDEGYEAGEWALTRMDGSPSPRLEAATEVANEMETHRSWFSATQPWDPEIWILRSDAAERLAAVESHGEEGVHSPRNLQRVTDSASGAGMLFSRLGAEVRYVEENGLKQALDEGPPRILVVPGLEVLSEGLLERLLEYVTAGGLVVADACPGWKDPFGRLATWRETELTRFLGGRCLDLESWRNAADVPGDQPQPAGWWYRTILSKPVDGDVHSTWTDGVPQTWTHRVGEGAICMIGTWFFHRFLLGPYPETSRWLRDILSSAFPVLPLRKDVASDDTVLRHLQHPEGTVIVLISESAQREKDLIPAFKGQLEWMDGKRISVSDQVSVRLPLDHRGIGYGLFRKES